MQLVRMGALALMIALAGGCDKASGQSGDESPGTTAAQAGASESGEATVAADPDDPGDDEELPPSSVTKDELVELISLSLTSPTGSKDRKGLKKKFSKFPLFKTILYTRYEANEWTLTFFDGGKLTEGATLLREAVDALPDQAIPLDPYDVPTFDEILATYQAKLAKAKEIDETLATKTEAKPLLDFLAYFDEIPSAQALKKAIKTYNPGSVPKEIVAEVKEALTTKSDELQGIGNIQEDLETRLTVMFFQYCLDMKLMKKVHPFLVDLAPKQAQLTYGKELLALAEQAAGDMKGTLQWLKPVYPKYDKLVEKYVQYKKLAEMEENGEWPVLKTRSYKKGHKGPAIKTLKKRLALEGYWPMDAIDDPSFGPKLKKAVKHYQKTHQLKQTGEVNKYTLKSMNTPMKKRLAQIALSLQRLRESLVEPGVPFYARVNIPQFEVEFWENGKLLKTHKVIVGNNKKEFNEVKMVVGPFNHTRLFKAEISTVVLNPYWRVPSRIVSDELEKFVEEDPDYYDKNHFTVKLSDSGTEFVMQQPGEWNALGRVKFLFPNPHSIYMHDTNKKSKFRAVIRAFSHGCIRVEDAAELAEFILIHTGRLNKKEFDKNFNKTDSEGVLKEVGVDLKEKIPIYIEYQSVSVDEDGFAQFFADIYRYDKAYFKGELPFEMEKEEDEQKIKQLKKWQEQKLENQIENEIEKQKKKEAKAKAKASDDDDDDDPTPGP